MSPMFIMEKMKSKAKERNNDFQVFVQYVGTKSEREHSYTHKKKVKEKIIMSLIKFMHDE